MLTHVYQYRPCSVRNMYSDWQNIAFSSSKSRCLSITNQVNKICINNCPTRCNTKQSIYYSASSLYMYRVSTTPISRSTHNSNYSLRYWSCFFVQLPPSSVAKLGTLEGGSCTKKIWPVPEAVFTVLCNPDDECGRHPKHVDLTCRIINRLLCAASRSTIINIDQRCTEP